MTGRSKRRKDEGGRREEKGIKRNEGGMKEGGRRNEKRGMRIGEAKRRKDKEEIERRKGE